MMFLILILHLGILCNGIPRPLVLPIRSAGTSPCGNDMFQDLPEQRRAQNSLWQAMVLFLAVLSENVQMRIP